MGTIISDNLKWDENSAYLINKLNKRIILLRKVATFCNDERELTQIYITFCRVILEQSCVLWSSTLTEENKVDLERCQKVALKIILGNKYKNYDDALKYLNMESLSDRREDLVLRWAKKAINHDKMKDLFPLNKKVHSMEMRKGEKYQIKNTHTERLRKSSIFYMQKILNEDESDRDQMNG